MNTERDVNARSNWKAQTFPYDYYTVEPGEECTYCLTAKQVEVLLGIVEPLAWKTRWWSDTQDVDQEVVLQFRNDITRRLMMGCCGNETPIQYRWTEDGTLQESTDGGSTWVDVPEKDPRNNSVMYPPMTGEDGADKRCLAATSGSDLIKAQVGDQLTDDMSRYTLSQLLNDWLNTVIQTSNPFQAIINVAANQIFALVISALRAALTDPVYDTLKCILFCTMEDDASFTQADCDEARSQITSMIGGIAGLFLEHLVYLLGPVGCTNVCRSGFAAAGDCDDCECPGDCGSQWDVIDSSHGTIIARGDNSIDIQAQAIGGNYYMILSTGDAAKCCLISSAVVLSGSTPSLTGWTDCGVAPVPGVPQHTGLFGYGSYCVDYFQMQDAGPFTMRLTFADC